MKEDFLENDILKKQRKIRSLKIMIVFCVSIIVIPYSIHKTVGLLIKPSETYVVTNGELLQEETLEGYIIREESIIEGNNSGKEMNKVKQEGERVAKGDTIFRYASQQEDELNKKITKIDEEIQKVIDESESSIFSSDKKMLESQILDEVDKIYQTNEIRKIQEYKDNISTYLSKKARILGEYAPSNSYLKQLINERADYEEKLNTVSEDVKANCSGMTSYKVDGLEDVLKIDDINNINHEFLENLKLISGQNIASSTEKGKIVNNYHCYIVFNSNKEEAKNAKVNDKIKIKIQNDVEITSTVENIIEEDDGSRTIAIKLKKDVERLIEYRKISFDIIWWSIDGFRIPNSTIIEENGIKYVMRNRNGYLNKMAVKILKQGEEYTIVSGYTKQELKELGLTDEEISNLKTITMYDRIQVN